MSEDRVLYFYKWMDRHCQIPMFQYLVTCLERSFFIRAIHCSKKLKYETFQFELLQDGMQGVRIANFMQVVPNVAEMCRSAKLLIHSKYENIFWTPYCVHELNNALKDISEIQNVSTLVATTRDVHMLISNHNTFLAMYKPHLRKEFLKSIETSLCQQLILIGEDVGEEISIASHGHGGGELNPRQVMGRRSGFGYWIMIGG